ncbi:MAG: MBL fold metallo-hydrolase [Desulfobacterales bacterium]
MEITILGSGGCMVIPKPCCDCRVCKEARQKGVPYERTGPSAFIHDENILIDTPAEISMQLNRCRITQVDYLIFSHLDPDHVEGFRVVEQIALDFRSWKAYLEKRIRLILPEYLCNRLKKIRSAYGPLLDYYEAQGFVETTSFKTGIKVGDIDITAIGVDRGSQIAFIYVFEKKGLRMVYAPCDIRPFPENRPEVANADLLVIQPGIFETGLKHGFVYPRQHISRSTLYTFEETVELSQRIGAKQVLFVHLEEYWNRSHDQYLEIAKRFDRIDFACDGYHTHIKK